MSALQEQLADALERKAEEMAVSEALRAEVRQHDEVVVPLLSLQACEVSEMQSRLVEIARSGSKAEVKDAALRAQTEGLLARLQVSSSCNGGVTVV